MRLPSPIPHPAQWFDEKTVVTSVVGASFPEGDERAMRDLAEAWSQAAKHVGPVLEEADLAAQGAVGALGGPDGPQGEALRLLWTRLGAAFDAQMLEEMGSCVAHAADVIEAAKLEIYIEVSRLLAELETLSLLAATTDAAAAAAEPAMLASRHVIAGIVDRAVQEVTDRHAAVSGGPTRLGRFSFGLPELADLSAVPLSDAGGSGATPAPAAEGGDLVMAYGVGTMGTAAGVMAMGQGGRPKATSLRGRYGERAIRGPEILSEITVGVIGGRGVSWSTAGQRVGHVIDSPPLAGSALRASVQATEALSSLDNHKPAAPPKKPADLGGSSPRGTADLGGSFTLAALVDVPERADRAEGKEPDAKAYEQLIASAVALPGAAPIPRRELPPTHQDAVAGSGWERHGELSADRLKLINAGGAAADPRLAGNTAEVITALLDTWLLGRARVASEGTHQNWKANLVELPADAQGFAQIEAALRMAGHGSAAVIMQEWVHGECHAVTVHNRLGELYYVDVQRVSEPVSVSPLAGSQRMRACVLDPDGTPTDLAQAG